MTLVHFPVDDNLLARAGVDPCHAGEELRLLAAAKLFELRRLSLSQAASLAGLPLADFMAELGKLKVSWLNLTSDELAHDIRMA